MRIAGWCAERVCIVVTLLCAFGPLPTHGEETSRSLQGLQVLYDFDSDSGPLVRDRSGASPPLNLHIDNMKAVERSAGKLKVSQATAIQSRTPVDRLNRAVRRSGELTIEAWIQPAKVEQQGPARIVSLSRNPTQRNVTLGQEGDRVDVRLRTTKTSTNGIPSLATDSASLQPRLTHVVYTRQRAGRTRIYLEGKLRAEETIGGQTSNWDDDFRLVLANEVGGGRPWLGTFHLVAIYSRALSTEEVARHFKAGPAAHQTHDQVANNSLSTAELHFRDAVAPILARHCLECHDTAVREGGLDLSRRDGLLRGGDNGKVLLSDKSPLNSRLWETVEGDEMPLDRPPLSRDEKAALRQWLEDGAVWPVDVIDPALYAHETGAAENWLRRLTRFEYVTTVRSAVGVDISDCAAELLPRDLRADGFNNTAYNLAVDLEHVQAYSRMAEIIVERMDVGTFAGRFTRKRRLIDKDMRELIEKMGKWLLRGPLSDEEIVSYRGISTTVASAGGSFDEAVGYVLQAMLQSPRFLYRMENQVGDGTSWPVDEYELASRLSYMIWGGPPDRELMKAAGQGALFDPQFVEAQVRRMLDDPQAIAQSRQFVTQWLNLDRLDNMAPGPERFPNWQPALATDMRNETLEFFEEIVWRQQRPLSNLLNAQVTFLSPQLARHYGLTPQSSEDRRYDLSSISGRGGLLTQGSVLTIGGDDASMVSRGLFVLHDLLRGAVQDPPPCVDTTPVLPRSGLTQRTIAEARIADSSCGGCHARFEPLAFGLEKYDGLGTWHETDRHGNRLREDGSILIPGTGTPIDYASSAELMDLLASSPRVQESLTWKLTQFALGRPLTAQDAPIVARIHNSAQQAGGTYIELMTAVAMSDLMQTTRTEELP